jgi:two-component system LytT family response regulator
MSGLLFPGEIRTLLADDEEVAIYRLKKALQAFPRIKLIGEVRDGISVVEFVNSHRPDLVFLDIRMPGLNGFEVLEQLEYTPLIVFVTAYEQYAVKAFEEHSLDYLLKPVEDERLALTIERVFQKRADEGELLQKLRQLIGSGRAEGLISTIPVKTGQRIQLVQLTDIYFFEAKDKYVIIHTRDEEKLIEYPLSYLEHRLPAEFVRVHRGFIVNKLKIRDIHKNFKGTFILTMQDKQNTAIRTAYSYSDAIKTNLLQP